MPSQSAKQHRFMEAIKHNPKFAKKAGVPQTVGADFVAADKSSGRYARGGAIGATLGLRPPPDKRSPNIPAMLSHTDRVSHSAGERLAKLRVKKRGM